MKKRLLLCLVLFIGLTSFAVHKFYTSIYQINYEAAKKRIQITTRIYVDDLNKALENKFSKHTHIGEPNETAEDIGLMNQYFLQHFLIKVNGVTKPLIFINKEMENNVVIGYYKINAVAKITSLEIQNSVLIDVFPDQQNIIQTNFNGKKQSLLLTNETTSGLLK